MGEERDRHDRDGAKPVDEAEALRLILAFAEALREEFGVGIDSHPGGEGNEAGVANRAFRTAVRCLLVTPAAPGSDPDAELTRALVQIARRRLAEAGVDGERVELLLASGPTLRDPWLTYLALAPPPVIEDLLGDRAVWRR
jgi:hypothetical protein